MRPGMLVIVLAISGCAGAPSKPQPAPEVVVASQTEGSGGLSASSGDVEALRKLRAKKLGVTLIHVNGVAMYCRTELKTGSHVAKESTCLTEEQLDDLHELTRQDVESFQKPSLPKAGK